MKKVTKAVIPAAGLGTRMLPISYAVPKEMLPIVDAPAVFYLVEEAVKSGITDILIITNRGKGAMEDFFDISVEYIDALMKKGRTDEAERIKDIAKMANVSFIRQGKATGLAHAVKKAEAFVGDDPFVVLYGDDIVFSDVPTSRVLIDAYEKFGKCVAGVKKVNRSELKKYCSLKVEDIEGEDKIRFCSDMIEKPAEGEEFSDFAILGRVLLTKNIFEAIDSLTPGACGEYQLTDAMASIARKEGMYAVEFPGERYDMGSKLGFLKANTVMGLSHSETAEEYRKFLKELMEKI
ncbi:MAG: UTP--glucose-1-phosphate uridylyltransferase [Ruminococcaceae bacterium]|nr:UTP--glucose-1-phosphate uridylyltransferase [Oscillospiraceae bacterium]